MPSFVHEQAIRLLEKHPAVLRELCSWVGINQPGPKVRLRPEHPELRVDVGVQGDVRQLRPDLLVREWDKAIRKLSELEACPYELPTLDTAATTAAASSAADASPASLAALWLVDVQASQDPTRPRAWLVYVVTIAYFYEIEPAFLILALGKGMESWCRDQVQQHKRLRAEENVRILGPSILAGRIPANLHVAAIMAVLYRRDAPFELVDYAVKALMATGDPDDVDFARMVPSRASQLADADELLANLL